MNCGWCWGDYLGLGGGVNALGVSKSAHPITLLTGQHVLLITDHSSLKRVLNEINRNQPLPVRVNNAHARLSIFNVDTLHKNDIEDMTVTQNVFPKAIILSRDTEHDEEEDKIDRGFCNAISLHEITQYDEDQRCHKLAKPPE